MPLFFGALLRLSSYKVPLLLSINLFPLLEFLFLHSELVSLGWDFIILEHQYWFNNAFEQPYLSL